MKPRFLLDENLRRSIATGARGHNPAIDIVRVGDPGAPAIGTHDPDILDFCELDRRILITKNRKSMPGHIADHVQAGKTFWGMLKVKEGRENEIGKLVETLLLIWAAEEAEAYVGKVEWVPY